MGDKTQISCIYHVNVHDEHFCSTYSTYVLLQADSACKKVRNLVHDVVP